MSTDQRVFNGRYEIIEPIARGGMAEVFRAHDQLLDRTVALKVLFPELSTDKQFVERFRREAQAAANLNHPNIVSVYDWGEEGSTYFIVMEYIDGISLSQMLREQGRLAPYNAASIACDVANGLAYAHEQGVIHRDIKPGNILITKSGAVKVTDFGIARARNTVDNLTQTGAVMGTATYFSPEQAQGYGVDGRSDLYSLGVVLYEMVTGEPPFSGENPVTVATKHVNEPVALPHTKTPDVSNQLEAVIMTALAKNPENRYANAQEFSSDLKRFLQGQNVTTSIPNETAMMTNVAKARDQFNSNATTAYNPNATTMMEAPPKKKDKRSQLYVVLLFIMLAVLAGLLYALWRILSPAPSSTVVVPNVIALSKSDATKQLEAQGLKITKVISQDSSQPANTVLKQDPQANTKVSRGTGVTLTVSRGTQSIAVPSLVGKTQQEAQNELSTLGLQVSVDPEPSSQPEGIVTAQDPDAGSKVAQNSQVTITVSSGPNTAIVPDVTGESVNDATTKLVQAGFSTTTQFQNSNLPIGQVISTNPAAGTSVKTGSDVTMIVSQGPASTTTETPTPSTA